jgi:periplasmic protein TonB
VKGMLTRSGDLPTGAGLAAALHLAALLLLGGVQAGSPPSLAPPRATRVSIHLNARQPPQTSPAPAHPSVTRVPRSPLAMLPAEPPAPRRVEQPRLTEPAAQRIARLEPPRPRRPQGQRLEAPPPDNTERVQELLPAVRLDAAELDGDVDAAPRPRQAIRPVYPLEARRRGESGRVVAVVHVTDGGRVARVEIAESSGHAALDRSARAALLEACFEPARRGAASVPARVRLTIIFELKG